MHASELNWSTLDQFSPSLPASFSRSRKLATSLAQLDGEVGEFEILELLGEGAFGKVFLARQISLDRLVALKVTADCGYEGRTMARLEHRRIVQVYSESVDSEHGLRLLCMQYVPGLTLLKLIEQLGQVEPSQRSGQVLIDILDRENSQPPALDPCSLADREILRNSTIEEAVCWIGQQLAEALAYAHGRQILRRDIKPANILLNQYGQPVLTDFSVSFQATAATKLDAGVFGGTLGYMAPEHRDAFDPTCSAGPETVDERSDIYSFGQVLLELATCQWPQRLATTVQPHSSPADTSASISVAKQQVATARVTTSAPVGELSETARDRRNSSSLPPASDTAIVSLRKAPRSVPRKRRAR